MSQIPIGWLMKKEGFLQNPLKNNRFLWLNDDRWCTSFRPLYFYQKDIIAMIHVHPAIPALQALQQTLQDCVAAKSQLHALNALVLTKAQKEMAARCG